MSPPRLELRGISKSFGSVQAVRGADFTLGSGQLHALLGENGAGKSTLMHVAAGLVQADRGEVLLNGRRVVLRSAREARQIGIGMVHQHFTSVPGFTVRENIALAAGWPLQPARLQRQVLELEERLGLVLSPQAKAETLSVADLQRLEILKVLATDASILLLDEPTGSLAPADAQEFLQFIRRLVDAGASAVLITHKLDEALRYADRITVLRRGEAVVSAPADAFTPAELAGAMLGSVPVPASAQPASAPGEILVSADRLRVSPLGQGPGLIDASFNVRGGETVGLAAVEGNGASELLRAVAGLVHPSGGLIRVQAPIAFVPEDRTHDGLIGEFNLSDNLTLGLGELAPWVKGGRIDRNLARRESQGILDRYNIIAEGPNAAASSLSGGNQQKLILARAVERKPRVLVAENPGRGLDIRAAENAFQQLRRAAARGTAVLIHSSDLDELLVWCDRIMVVTRGQVTVLPPHAGRDDVGRCMLGQT